MDTPEAQIRLATLNMASGRALDPRAALPPRPTTDALDDAALQAALSPLGPGGLAVDVLALQEVDLQQPRSHRVDQAAAAARALGVDPATGAAFAPALVGTPSTRRDWSPAPPTVVVGRGIDSPQYGVALVSRLPVLEWQVLRLPAGSARLPLPVQHPQTGRRGVLLFPDEPRVALAALVDGGDLGTLTVVSTHLSFWAPTAIRQLRLLRRWLADVPGPVVVAGDLNLHGRVPALLLGADPLVRQRTFPGDTPRLQLDHLLLRRDAGAAVLGRHPAGAALLGVGDHRAVVAVLTR